jgi:hypothetical protein
MPWFCRGSDPSKPAAFGSLTFLWKVGGVISVGTLAVLFAAQALSKDAGVCHIRWYGDTGR